jgi:hypothetical protein
MTDPNRPLPLQDVYAIVERRRRQRARNRAIVAPAAAVGAAGLAGLLVVAIQTGATPAAPAAAPPSLSSSPSPSPSAALAAPPTGAPATTPPVSRTAPPFDPDWLRPDLLPGLASALFDRPDAEQAQLLSDAADLSAAWEVPFYPTAKAVVTKADLMGATVSSADPRGADKLISRYRAAGYTDEYAAELAAAWDTDPRSAEIVGGLVVQAGCCG